MALDWIRRGPWTLAHARRAARQVLADPALLPQLRRYLLHPSPDLQRRAADIARRVTEREPALLAPCANLLIGLLADPEISNWRTRAHLGLVLGRCTSTHAQRMRVAPLLRSMVQDRSNVVRCSGIEGFGQLALAEPALLEEAHQIIQHALASGTPAMQCRARNWLLLAYKD